MLDLDFDEEEKITLSSLTTPIYKLDEINEKKGFARAIKFLNGE